MTRGEQARQFGRRLFDRINADHPNVPWKWSWDGAEFRAEVTGVDGAGVSLTRTWGNLCTPDQQAWFEARFRELIAQVIR